MITLTEKAAAQVKKSLEKRGRGIGLRLGVKTVGCSGLAYHLDYAEEAKSDDARFESFGVAVLVDRKSLPYVDGTTLDFVREGLSEKFRFDNPNVKGECGCGESFSV